jgi:hypothetical protein
MIIYHFSEDAPRQNLQIQRLPARNGHDRRLQPLPENVHLLPLAGIKIDGESQVLKAK